MRRGPTRKRDIIFLKRMALEKKKIFMSSHQHDNDDGGGRESKKKFYANFS